MRILHIDKFLGRKGFPLGGGGLNVRTLGELQTGAGHQVFFWGCASDDDGNLPEFHDFSGANPRDLPRMIHNRAAAEMLDRFLRLNPVDVAHLHNIYHHLTPAILPVLARHGVGMVMTLRDYRLACPTKHFLRPDGPCTRCLPNKFYHAAGPRCAGLAGAGAAIESLVQRFFRRYFRWVDFFICPTKFMRQVVVRTGAPAGKAVVVRNIIRAMPAVGKEGDGRELLFAGRLSAEKGPRLMLDLARRLPDAKIVMAGDGPMLEELRRSADAEGLKSVSFLGRVEHTDMARHYSSAAAVVVPSLCYENSPATMLEAMSAGRCVIVPDHPPLREWVQDGVTGRLFAGGSADSLAAAASKVLADHAGRLRMAKAGRELVARRHDPRAIMARITELYEESIRRCALR